MASQPARTPSRRAAGLITGSAALSLVAVAVLVMTMTTAAWTTQAEPVDGSWGTATLGLERTALVSFNAEDMVPGQTETGSVTIHNTSSVDLDVRLYGTDLVATTPDGETASLAEHLNVTVGTSEAGTEVYTGTLADFPDAYADGSDALADLAADGTRMYHFTVTLDEATPDAYQGAAASITFVWEGQTVS